MNPAAHSDYRWYPNGQSAYSGSLWRLVQRLDRLFLSWAGRFQATDFHVPAFIPAHELNRFNYFRSFPHLATFPVVMQNEPETLRVFAEQAVAVDGVLQLRETAPARDLMTPACCYHFYILHQNSVATRPRYLTTCATCFRRENEYIPMQRQWSFTMREIVCIGTVDEVTQFLDGCRQQTDAFVEEVGLTAIWKSATDPFFDPTHNPLFVAQKVAPLKKELLFQDRLALASINYHRAYFAEAFNLKRDDTLAATGCIGFGLDRWVFAILSQFGPDERDWPLPSL
jgi:hypothetical protein